MAIVGIIFFGVMLFGWLTDEDSGSCGVTEALKEVLEEDSNDFLV